MKDLDLVSAAIGAAVGVVVTAIGCAVIKGGKNESPKKVEEKEENGGC